MTFHCTKCGECCKNIRHIRQLADFDDGNGVCIYLKNNLCSIYENRPEVCNVDFMYEKYFSAMYTKQEFYKLNEKACEKLQKVAAEKTSPDCSGRVSESGCHRQTLRSDSEVRKAVGSGG